MHSADAFPLTHKKLRLGDAFGSFCAYGHTSHTKIVQKDSGDSAGGVVDNQDSSFSNTESCRGGLGDGEHCLVKATCIEKDKEVVGDGGETFIVGDKALKPPVQDGEPVCSHLPHLCIPGHSVSAIHGDPSIGTRHLAFPSAPPPPPPPPPPSLWAVPMQAQRCHTADGHLVAHLTPPPLPPQRLAPPPLPPPPPSTDGSTEAEEGEVCGLPEEGDLPVKQEEPVRPSVLGSDPPAENPAPHVLPPRPTPPPPPPTLWQLPVPASAVDSGLPAESTAELFQPRAAALLSNSPPLRPPPPPPPPFLPIQKGPAGALPVNQGVCMPVAVVPKNTVRAPPFQPPAPWSLPFGPSPFSMSSAGPNMYPRGSISFRPLGLASSMLPPPPVQEALGVNGKRRADDKYLVETKIRTKRRCFDPPSERGTVKPFSLDLDTVVTVIGIISQQFNDLENPLSIPKAFWMLSKETDKVAGRNMRFINKVADGSQKALVENSRHPIPSVTFSSVFNMQVNIPQGVKKVWFGVAYNQPTELPRSVVDVTFGHEFDQPVVLPPQIRKVHFGHKFDRPVDLPHSLRDIHFGNNFNQLVTLPRGLKKVVFGNRFTKKLGPLPPTLEEIRLKKNWNYDILLPDTIRVCHFRNEFDKLVTLGPNVEKLHLGAIQPIPDPLPLSLKILDVCRSSNLVGLEDLVPVGCQIVRR